MLGSVAAGPSNRRYPGAGITGVTAVQGFITGCYLTSWKLGSTALLVLTAMHAGEQPLACCTPAAAHMP